MTFRNCSALKRSGYLGFESLWEESLKGFVKPGLQSGEPRNIAQPGKEPIWKSSRQEMEGSLLKPPSNTAAQFLTRNHEK